MAERRGLSVEAGSARDGDFERDGDFDLAGEAARARAGDFAVFDFGGITQWRTGRQGAFCW